MAGKPQKTDRIILKSWQCYDGCPVCRLFRKAAEEGKELSSSELKEAFAKAQEEAAID